MERLARALLSAGSRTADNEIDERLRMEEAFEEIVPLAVQDNQSDERFRVRFTVATDEFLRVFF